MSDDNSSGGSEKEIDGWTKIENYFKDEQFGALRAQKLVKFFDMLAAMDQSKKSYID